MLVQVVAPTAEEQNKILDLASTKSFIRVVGTDEDALIQELIDTSITEAQDITGLQFASATYELYLPRLKEEIKLPKNPVDSIVSVEYMDLEGDYQTINPSMYYLYKLYGVASIVFSEMPNVSYKHHKKAFKITFKSGFKDGQFPTDLKQWLKVRISTLYEHREEIVIGTITSETKHVDCILSRYKIRSL